MFVGVNLSNPLLWIIAVLYFMILIVVVLAIAAGYVLYGFAWAAYRGIDWLSWTYRHRPAGRHRRPA
jgi:hypothetical protein